CDAAAVARSTHIAVRRGAHVFPKFLFGQPTDRFMLPAITALPRPLRRGLAHLLLAISQGSQARRGLPVPPHAIDAAHPTISSAFLPLVAEGRIEVRPGIAALEGDQVRFSDDRRE